MAVVRRPFHREKGVSGTINMSISAVGIGPMLPNGDCKPLTLAAQYATMIGSGTVSY